MLICVMERRRRPDKSAAMAWHVYVRRVARLCSHQAGELAAALAVTCVLMQKSVPVKRIEDDGGFALDADAICARLCHAPCTRRRSGRRRL